MPEPWCRLRFSKTGEALCGPYGVDGEILPNLTFFKIIQREGNVRMIKDDDDFSI